MILAPTMVRLKNRPTKEVLLDSGWYLGDWRTREPVEYPAQGRLWLYPDDQALIPRVLGK